ncbi:Two-pore potassium channel 5 [Platanthera zijinensis]|uniref:Two-pore potassium channel 5 n=1 Tax=Platanthera zijinensis TaxID=2320716 RepID=A0AAP0G9S7_9ASPA
MQSHKTLNSLFANSSFINAFFCCFYGAILFIVLFISFFPRNSFKGLHFDDNTNSTVPKKYFIPFFIYFQVVSFTTVGYGDIVSRTCFAKIFFSIISNFGVSALSLFISSVVSDFFDYFRICVRYIVALVFIIFVLGDVVIHFTEKLHFADSMYLLIMTFTSVGYGDIHFKSFAGRLFASFWLILAMIS